MIMVVIGVAVVLVHEILAEDMVGERMALFLVVIVGHSRRAPSNSVNRSHWLGRVMAWAICQGQNAGRPGSLQATGAAWVGCYSGARRRREPGIQYPPVTTGFRAPS